MKSKSLVSSTVLLAALAAALHPQCAFADSELIGPPSTISITVSPAIDGSPAPSSYGANGLYLQNGQVKYSGATNDFTPLLTSNFALSSTELGGNTPWAFTTNTPVTDFLISDGIAADLIGNEYDGSGLGSAELIFSESGFLPTEWAYFYNISDNIAPDGFPEFGSATVNFTLIDKLYVSGSSPSNVPDGGSSAGLCTLGVGAVIGLARFCRRTQSTGS